VNPEDELPDSDGGSADEDGAEEPGIAEALRAAFGPAHLEPESNERLIAQALEQAAEAATRERAAAEALRSALERSDALPEAELSRALRHAVKPAELDPSTNERLLDAALSSRARPSNVVFGTFGALAVGLSLAASVALWISNQSEEEGELSRSVVFVASRSLAPLFDTAEQQNPSERMDRIANVRRRELRENRYASWGVR
jgi:hypothetical protein